MWKSFFNVLSRTWDFFVFILRKGFYRVWNWSWLIIQFSFSSLHRASPLALKLHLLLHLLEEFEKFWKVELHCTTQHCSNWIIFALTIALNFLQWHSSKSQSEPQPQHQAAYSHLRWIAQRWAGRWLNGAKSSLMVQISVQLFLCSL